MTKLRWDKADQYEPDPGAMVDVPQSTRPERWTPPQERARKEAERAKERRELQERSELHDVHLMTARAAARVRCKMAGGLPLSGLDRLILKSVEKAE